MEAPPDPSVAESKCKECDHQDYIQILSVADEQGRKQFWLRNDKTGEECPLVCSVAQLHFKGNRGYLQLDGNKTEWVTKFLSTSVWQTPEGEEFACIRHSDGSSRKWLSELSGLKQLTITPITCMSPPLQLHMWMFNTCSNARNGRCFIELSSMIAAFGKPCDSKGLAKQWRNSWEAMLRRRGFNESDFLVPFRSKSGTSRFLEGMCSDEYAVSVPAALHFMVHMSQWHCDPGLLENFLMQYLIGNGSLMLNIETPGQNFQLNLGPLMDIPVRDIKNRLYQEKGWKNPKLDGSTISFANLLRALESCKNSERLYRSILMAAGTSILGHLQSAPMTQGANHSQECNTRLQAKLARDQCQQELAASSNLGIKRKASQELPSTMSKKAKVSKLDETHTSHDRYQYWLACRRAMLNCKHMCLVDDDTTIGGKHRMASVLMNLDTGEAMWAQPLVAWRNFSCWHESVLFGHEPSI